MTVLLGRVTAGTTGDFNAAGHSAAWTFVAVASGQLKYIYSQTKVSNPTGTTVNLGIYADSAGNPGARLGFAAVDDLTAARGTGVFRATLATPVTIVSGTTYHLARHMATEQCEFQGDAVANTYEETTGVSNMVDPWPATAAGGITTIIWGEDEPVSGVYKPRPLLPKLRPVTWRKMPIFPGESLLPLSSQQFIDLSPATVTNIAQAITQFKSKTLGVTSIANVAQAITKFKSKSLGVAAETDVAQVITKFKSKSVGVATEADAAQALNVDKIKILIPATETDAAQLLSFSQGGGDILMTLTPATESDVAQALLRVKRITLGPAASLNAAQVLTHLKRVTLGLASEADAAQVLIHLKRLSLSPALTTNVAQTLTRYKSKTLGVVSVSEVAQALVYTKTIFKTLNPALEFDLAVPLSIAGQEVTIVYRYRGPITIGRF